MKNLLRIDIVIEKDSPDSMTDKEREKFENVIIDLAETFGCGVGGSFELSSVDQNGHET